MWTAGDPLAELCKEIWHSATLPTTHLPTYHTTRSYVISVTWTCRLAHRETRDRKIFSNLVLHHEGARVKANCRHTPPSISEGAYTWPTFNSICNATAMSQPKVSVVQNMFRILSCSVSQLSSARCAVCQMGAVAFNRRPGWQL